MVSDVVLCGQLDFNQSVHSSSNTAVSVLCKGRRMRWEGGREGGREGGGGGAQLLRCTF